MAVGDTERAVATAAALDGIELLPMMSQSWLNTRGHLALPVQASAVLSTLQRAFAMLRGDEGEQRSKALRPLPNDLVHRHSMTMIEVDEFQHFTTFRASIIDLTGWSDGTLADEYRSRCEQWGLRADRYRATKQAKGFPGGYSRGRQRAYNDLLRDLVCPLLGWQVVRVPAAGLDGNAAYGAARDRIRAAVASSLGPR